MGMMKNYKMKLIEIGDNGEQQDAIEWAIDLKWMPMTYRFDVDRMVVEQNLLAFLRSYREMLSTAFRGESVLFPDEYGRPELTM